MTDAPIYFGNCSSNFTIGFITPDDLELPNEDVEIKTSRHTVKDRIETYREKLSDYAFVIRLEDLKFKE